MTARALARGVQLDRSPKPPGGDDGHEHQEEQYVAGASRNRRPRRGQVREPRGDARRNGGDEGEQRGQRPRSLDRDEPSGDGSWCFGLRWTRQIDRYAFAPSWLDELARSRGDDLAGRDDFARRDEPRVDGPSRDVRARDELDPRLTIVDAPRIGVVAQARLIALSHGS